MSSDLSALAKASLCRELENLRDGVRGFAADLTEEQFWTRPLPESNSVGHLVLHLTGNLNHFVGAQLGGIGYVRDREREFTEANHPSKDDTMARLDAAVALFRRVVEGLSPEQLAAPHPEARFGPVLQALLHLVSHFSLHRGQMSYITRLVKTAR
jgi:hypothetical protein